MIGTIRMTTIRVLMLIYSLQRLYVLRSVKLTHLLEESPRRWRRVKLQSDSPDPSAKFNSIPSGRGCADRQDLPVQCGQENE